MAVFAAAFSFPAVVDFSFKEEQPISYSNSPKTLGQQTKKCFPTRNSTGSTSEFQEIIIWNFSIGTQVSRIILISRPGHNEFVPRAGLQRDQRASDGSFVLPDVPCLLLLEVDRPA